MAKRKSSKQKAEGGGKPVGNAGQMTQPGEDLARFYETGVWAGIPQYRCTLCKFDTLHKSTMIDHLGEVHRIGKPGTTQAAIASNQDVTDQVSTDGDLKDVFEIELEEVSTTVDEQGNEHKTFTVKE